MNGGPLAGVRVLEFSEMIAAPFAGMHLSDLGAEIIKVESPTGDPWRTSGRFAPDESRGFLSLNRNKRGIALDLKSPDGVRAIHRLVREVDVVTVNYRPDTPARLGIDESTLRGINERIVYVEVTAMGRRGPQSHQPGYDLVAQAVTGMMLTGQRVDLEGAPLPITPAIADYGSGIVMAMAVCAALYERERTGRGSYLQTSLLATSLAFQTASFVRTAMDTGDSDLEHARDDLDAQRRAIHAYYRVYDTADGAIAVACLTPALRQRMADAIGVVDRRHYEDLGGPTPAALQAANEFMAGAIARFAERPTAEWLTVLDAVGVPAGPVRPVAELFDDPQVRANDLVTTVDHPVAGRTELAGPVVAGVFERAPTAPPTLGQHTDEVLAEVGYGADELADLRARHVIR